MALILVRRIIVEQIYPVINKPTITSRKFIHDCNETIDIEEYYESGEEKHYTNDRQTVAFNITPNVNYGYDLTINFSDFDFALYAFLSNNNYIYDSYNQANLFGNGTTSYGSFSVNPETGQTATRLANAKRWAVRPVSPAIVEQPSISPTQFASQGILPSSNQTDPNYLGVYSLYGQNRIINPQVEYRRYITFDAERKPDKIFTDSLYRLRSDLENKVIVSDGERYRILNRGWGYFLQEETPGGQDWSSSYYLLPKTEGRVNNITGFCQFSLMQGFSVLAVSGLAGTVAGSWRTQSVPGLKYNFMCVLESSSLPFKYNEGDSDYYDIARFYYEMRQLPTSYKADQILRSTYMYITFHPDARRFVANMDSLNPDGSTLYTQDATAAATNYANVMNFVNNDKTVVLFDNLYNLRQFFVGNGTTLESDHNRKSSVLRREVEFENVHDILMTSYIFFMPTSNASNPWVPPTDTTPNVFRKGIPFKAPTWYTLVMQQVPVWQQGFSARSYARGEQAIYQDEMESAMANEVEGLTVGGMSATHSTQKTYTNLFKTTVFSERFTGTDKEGYYKLEFPVCYSDPPSLNINNTEFSSMEAIIHAREDFVSHQSSMYMNLVDELEE